jgi:hypothetical protein
MVSADDVALAAISSVNTGAGLLQCVRWASERYREVSNRAKLTHLHRITEVSIPPPVTGGMATVAIGSSVVSGDSTSSPLWTSALIGRFFRGQQNWYEITGIVPSTTAAQLLLRSRWAEPGQGPTGYNIVARTLTLADNIRFLGKFVHVRMQRELVDYTRIGLDIVSPGRQLLNASGPRAYADLGVDPESGRRRIEIYPSSMNGEQLVYDYYQLSPDLTVDTPIPPEIDTGLLKAGVLVDICRWEMAKCYRLGQIDKGAYWANELRRQATEWESKMLDVIRADRADEDLTMILRLRKGISGEERFPNASMPTGAGWGGAGWAW